MMQDATINGSFPAATRVTAQPSSIDPAAYP